MKTMCAYVKRQVDSCLWLFIGKLIDYWYLKLYAASRGFSATVSRCQFDTYVRC